MGKHNKTLSEKELFLRQLRQDEDRILDFGDAGVAARIRRCIDFIEKYADADLTVKSESGPEK